MKNAFTLENLLTLQERIKSLHENSVRKWGKMNVSQMLCHCTDQLRMALGQIEIRDNSNFLSTTIIRFMVVYLIDAPKEKVKTLSEIDQEKKGTKPTNFDQDKSVLLGILLEITEKAKVENLKPHGFFGKLSNKEWGILIYKHLDHHLRQFGV